tara:strand:- start:405 stop:695 length:291 start_codon:yes stop_codon:yes gene_type:complete
MSKIKHPSELDFLYNKGKISLKESNEYRTEWAKLNTEQKKEYSKMTEIQLLRTIVKKMITSNDIQRSIKGWITFLGWVVLIGIAFNIIMALGLLSL